MEVAFILTGTMLFFLGRYTSAFVFKKQSPFIGRKRIF